jgi:hypothetical protein
MLESAAIDGQAAVGLWLYCAGHLADGETFFGLVDRRVTSVDRFSLAEQLVCWLRLWSVDARLFGWKRIEVPPRRRSSNSV